MKTILTTLNAYSVTRAGDVLQAASLRDGIDFAGSASSRRRAFTLIELLVVIVIIGILASIGLPAMKGIGKTNVTAGAYRQLLDDLAFARLKAINERSTVYMVFVPTNVAQRLALSGGNPLDTRVLTNLVTGQYMAYALMTDRSVGDQPGRPTRRYLTSWKTLPDGIIFPPYLFGSLTNSQDQRTRSLRLTDLPFPNATSPIFSVPYIAFNAFGQLVPTPGFEGQDRLLAFGRGSVLFTRDNAGNLVSPVPDVQLIPPGQDTNNLQYVRIDAITGRAKAEIPEFK